MVEVQTSSWKRGTRLTQTLIKMDRNEVLKGLRKCKQSQCEYTRSQMYTKAYTNLHRSMAGDQTRTVIPSHFPYSVVCVEGFLKSQLSHPFGMLRASIFLFSHSPFFFSFPPPSSSSCSPANCACCRNAGF